jgi:hypothetical protein
MKALGITDLSEIRLAFESSDSTALRDSHPALSQAIDSIIPKIMPLLPNFFIGPLPDSDPSRFQAIMKSLTTLIMLLFLGLRLSRNEYKIIWPHTDWGLDEGTMKAYPDGTPGGEWDEVLFTVTPAIGKLGTNREVEAIACLARVVFKPEEDFLEDMMRAPTETVNADDEETQQANRLNPTTALDPAQQTAEEIEVAAALEAIHLESQRQATAAAEAQAKREKAEALRIRVAEAARIQRDNPVRFEVAKGMIEKAIRSHQVRIAEMAENKRVRMEIAARENERARGPGGFGGGPYVGGWVEEIEGDAEMDDDVLDSGRQARGRNQREERRPRDTLNRGNSRPETRSPNSRNESKSTQEPCVHCGRTNHTSHNCKSRGRDNNLRVPEGRHNRNESSGNGRQGSNQNSGNNFQDNSQSGQYCTNCKMRNHNTEDCTRRPASGNREEPSNRSVGKTRGTTPKTRGEPSNRGGRIPREPNSKTRGNSSNTQERLRKTGRKTDGGERDTSRNNQNLKHESARFPHTGGSSGREVITCGNCKKRGHRTENCRRKKASGSMGPAGGGNAGGGSGGQVQSGGACGACGKMGHASAGCPEDEEVL